MGRFERLLVVVLGLLFVVVLVSGCAYTDQVAADRARSEAAAASAAAAVERERAQGAVDLERARADADVQRLEAAERAAAEGHQRALDLVPVLVVLVGSFALMGIGLLVWSDRRRVRPAAVDHGAVLALLQQQQEQWKVLAQLARRGSLPVDVDGDRRDLVMVDRSGRWHRGLER